MEKWQINLLVYYGTLAGLFFIGGIIKSYQGKAYEKFLPLNFIGGFVWGDAAIFGFFWAIISLFILLFGNWRIFEIIFLSFWLIRSLGEMIYWLNQQFAQKVRVKPEELWFYPLFKNDSVWFVYQIFWQCVAVASLVLLISVITS